MQEGNRSMEPIGRQLDAARRGESEALSILYRQFLSGVFGYIATRVPDRATAEDLTSEVFLKMVAGWEWWGTSEHLSLYGPSADCGGARCVVDAINTLTEEQRQVLIDFDQQLSAASSVIQELSSVADRERLSSELAALKVDARQKLRWFLPQLALAERLVTTDELGRLGDIVPRSLSVEIVLNLLLVESVSDLPE